MLNKRRLYYFMLFIVLMITACQQQTIYHHYEHIADTGWGKNDEQVFEIPPIQASGKYIVEAELRIDRSYPFQRLTLHVDQTIYPRDERIQHEIDCDLIDKHGTMKGDGISYFTYRFAVSNFTLNQGDSLRISISHNMKRETMPGITDVGIRLTKN